MDDLGLVLVELAQQVDRPCPGDQDQLHRMAKRAALDFLFDLPELAGQIERCGPARVGGEEQDLDRLHPDLSYGAKVTAGDGSGSESQFEARIRRLFAAANPSVVSATAPAIGHRSAAVPRLQ